MGWLTKQLMKQFADIQNKRQIYHTLLGLLALSQGFCGCIQYVGFIN